MADEPKAPPPGGPSEPPVKTPDAGGVTPPVKPAAAAPKPALKAEPWSSPLVEMLEKRFPGAMSDPSIFRREPSLTVAKESLVAVCEFLKGEEGGGYKYLVDETAVDYPKRDKRFEIVYHLYSFQKNDRLRLKVLAGEGEKIPSVTGVWPTANWLEREVYDMFGVEYDGHPDLRRILLPDEWVGYPLRKDYDILRQDDAWVQTNLNIKSGQ
jgi:NADH-quinone oxidoreductase subunit C